MKLQIYEEDGKWDDTWNQRTQMQEYLCEGELLVDMVNCYWTSQFYHKSVRSCFILLKKESRIYAGSGVSQTPRWF